MSARLELVRDRARDRYRVQLVAGNRRVLASTPEWVADRSVALEQARALRVALGLGATSGRAVPLVPADPGRRAPMVPVVDTCSTAGAGGAP